MTDSVLTTIENGIATLRINRPDNMNSLDSESARAIRDSVEALAVDDTVRVMVVASEGRTFSAGGDFNWVLSWPQMDAIARRVGADSLMAAVQAIYDFPKPSIARVHGATVGGGIGLMLACDFAVAAYGARFGLTSVRNGLLAGIAIPTLIETVGPRMARQLLMHGGIFDSATALRIGMIDQLVDIAVLDATVTTLAEELKLGAPSVQTLIKKLVTQINAQAHDASAAEVLGIQVANQCVTEEATEGMQAFLEKRKPRWAD
jgi:methylglutaconyl-CoA hydratase